MNEIDNLKKIQAWLKQDLNAVNRALQLLQGNNSSASVVECDNSRTPALVDVRKEPDWPGIASAIRHAVLAMEGRKFTTTDIRNYCHGTYPNQEINESSLAGAIHKMRTQRQIEAIVPRVGRRAAKYVQGTVPICVDD